MKINPQTQMKELLTMNNINSYTLKSIDHDSNNNIILIIDVRHDYPFALSINKTTIWFEEIHYKHDKILLRIDNTTIATVNSKNNILSIKNLVLRMLRHSIMLVR